jgi:outer membrane protein OmpA-like peptidoglycan-associated protein
MRYLISAILFASLCAVGSDAEACGFKVITIRRAPKYREIHQTRMPKEAAEPREVVAAPPKTEPLAAGPVQKEERTMTAQKQPEPEPPPAAPEPEEAAPAPAPAPAEAAPVAKAEKPPRSFVKEVLFKSNSAELTDKARASLQANARWLKAHGGAGVVIEGHSDQVGPSEYNMELSERRAAAVRDALVEAGVDVSSIEVAAYGEDRPAYKGARNRRAAIVVKDTATAEK